MDIKSVLCASLDGLDEDMAQYIGNMLEDLSLAERQDAQCLFDTIGPFLMDADYADESAAKQICRGMSVMLGGGHDTAPCVEETPALLAAPVRISERPSQAANAPLVVNNLVDPGAKLSRSAGAEADAASRSESVHKHNRRLKKVSADSLRQVQEEAAAQAAARQEMAAARMAAILARRKMSRQAAAGVHLDRVSVPHPAGAGDIISDVSLSLSPNRIYGLIGRNGSGKSTLLRALASYKLPDIQHLSIYLVEQSVEGNSESAKDWVLKADVERTALIEEEARLSHLLHSGRTEPLPPDLAGINLEVVLAECYERMDSIGADGAEGRAVRVLTGLGFSERTVEAPTERLSGGWAMRAALAAALFMQPDLLLLDEPTNHLDVHAIMWLQHWLQNEFRGIAVVVSHDHCFLSDICTDVLELRAKSSKHGVAERKIAASREREALSIKKEKLQISIGKEGKKIDQSQKKSKIKKLEELGKQSLEIEEFDEEVQASILLPSPASSFDPFEKLVRIENVTFAYSDDPSSTLFEGADMCIIPNSRICICGKNGSGKTSLLDVVCGDSVPTVGAVRRHQGSTLTRLQQHHYRGDQLDRDLSPLDHLRRLPCSDKTAIGIYEPGTRLEEKLHRSYLSNFGLFGPLALVPTKYLSGGQRMRVALSIALYSRPDVLVLDEPTNHLDGETVYALCEALQIFTGAVIFVSHDETFVNSVLNREGRPEPDVVAGFADRPVTVFAGMEGIPVGELWVLSKQRLQRFDGNFSEYKRVVSKRIAFSK